MISDEPRGPVEEAREVRGDPILRIPQRRAVAQPDQREELIQLAVAVHGERPAAQIVERDRVFRDDWRQEHAHAAILTR